MEQESANLKTFALAALLAIFLLGGIVFGYWLGSGKELGTLRIPWSVTVVGEPSKAKPTVTTKMENTGIKDAGVSKQNSGVQSTK